MGGFYILSLVVMGFGSFFVVMLAHNASVRVWPKVAVSNIVFGCILTFGLHLFIVETVVEVETAEESISIYQSKIDSLDAGFPAMASLNPEVLALLNQDSPIKAAMESKSRFLRDLRYEESKLLNAKRTLMEVDYSIFRFLIPDSYNKYKPTEGS